MMSSSIARATLAVALSATASVAHALPSAPVRVAPLHRGSLSRDIDAYGQLELATARNIDVSFPRAVEVLAVDVRAGQRVRRGQPLLRCTGVPGSDLPWRQALAALRQARSDLARAQRLAARQLATQADLAAARRALADARVRRDAARAQQLGSGQRTVRAAFDGVVETVAVVPGAQLPAGSSAMRLAPQGALQAVVGVSPRVAAQLRVGQPAHLQLVFEPALQADARVLQIAGALDPRSRMVDVTLQPESSAAHWFAGSAVQVEFALQTWHGWVVPRQAVLVDPTGQAYVFQDNHGHAHRVDVTLDRDTATGSGISGPLDPALPLVVLGNYELSDGMALRVQR